jgi:hypothetical protein
MSFIPLWGAGLWEIHKAIISLFDGKSRSDCEEIAEGVARLARALARGEKPSQRSDPLRREEHVREGWARMVASDVVGAALGASERSPCSGAPPSADQQALLREIAKLALWHMRNAPEEARELVRVMEIERLKQPHPGDDPPQGLDCHDHQRQ